MKDTPISTRPPTSSERILKEKFAESLANQSEQMDKLGQQLITLELAIPGLYATALKLIGGDKASLTANPSLYVIFACWFLALVLTLGSLIPRKWSVNTNIMKQDSLEESYELGIEDFFYKTAQYKRRLIIASSLLFFVGVLTAALTMF